MAVPTAITDLSTTIASNSPAGSESVSTTDDYLRALSAFIAQNYANKAPKDAPTFTNGVTVSTGNLAVSAGTLSASGNFAINTNKFVVTAASGNSSCAGTFQATGLIYGRAGGSGLGQVVISTSAPSGGASGDLWLRYTA